MSFFVYCMYINKDGLKKKNINICIINNKTKKNILYISYCMKNNSKIGNKEIKFFNYLLKYTVYLKKNKNNNNKNCSCWGNRKIKTEGKKENGEKGKN